MAISLDAKNDKDVNLIALLSYDHCKLTKETRYFHLSRGGDLYRREFRVFLLKLEKTRFHEVEEWKGCTGYKKKKKKREAKETNREAQ